MKKVFWVLLFLTLAGIVLIAWEKIMVFRIIRRLPPSIHATIQDSIDYTGQSDAKKSTLYNFGGVAFELPTSVLLDAFPIGLGSEKGSVQGGVYLKFQNGMRIISLGAVEWQREELIRDDLSKVLYALDPLNSPTNHYDAFDLVYGARPEDVTFWTTPASDLKIITRLTLKAIVLSTGTVEIHRLKNDYVVGHRLAGERKVNYQFSTPGRREGVSLIMNQPDPIIQTLLERTIRLAPTPAGFSQQQNEESIRLSNSPNHHHEAILKAVEAITNTPSSKEYAMHLLRLQKRYGLPSWTSWAKQVIHTFPTLKSDVLKLFPVVDKK